LAKDPDHLTRSDLQQGSDEPVNLRQQEDYSLQQMERREQAAAIDVGETYRQIIRQAERIDKGDTRTEVARGLAPAGGGRGLPSAVDRLRPQSEEYLREVYPGRRPGFVYDASVPSDSSIFAKPSLSYADARVAYANELLTRFQDERRPRSSRELSDYPYLSELRQEFEKSYGQKLSDDDINNLIMWGQAESAANAYARHVNSGNLELASNIAKTISDPSTGNPVMASIFGSLVEDAVREYVEPAAKDQNFLDKSLEWLGDKASTALGYLMVPGDKFFDESVAVAEFQRDRPESRLNLGSLAASIMVDPGGYEEAKAKTEPGNFNENYLKQLEGDPNRGLYTPLEIELAKDIVRRQSLQEENPVSTAWNEREDRMSEDVASFFTSLQFSFGPDAERINKLIRQVQSVELSNYAAQASGGANPDLEYDPSRGDEWFSNSMSISNFGYRILTDPINLVPIPMRAGLAAKWSLGKLRPGAVDEFGNPLLARDVLSKKSLLGFDVNTSASRYFDRFAKDLNRLEDLETAVRNADSPAQLARAKDRVANHRRRMSRQYREMPEQLIESFRTNPAHKRNAEGKFDLETVANYIDDTNEAFLVMQGKVGTKAAQEGVVEAADLAAIETFLSERPLFAQSVAAATETRALMIPRRGPIGLLRQNMVNSVIADVMPSGAARRILERSFDEAATPAQIAQKMDEEFLQVGKLLAGNKKGPGRWFSSIPTGLVINLDNANGAKEFYRFARQFMDRGTASFLADAFRLGNPASRRTLVAATYRSGMASRGVVISRGMTDDWMTRTTGAPTRAGDGQVTGSMSGEAYSVAIEDGVIPSQRLAKDREQRAAMRRATTPEGEQEQLLPGAGSIMGVTEPPVRYGVIPRVVDDKGNLQLSQTLNEFKDADAEFMRLFDDAQRLLNDPNASIEAQTTAYRLADERESLLGAIYSREIEILEAEKALAQLPRFRTLDDGTREAIFPGHSDANITQRAQQLIDEMDLPTPVASDFELASGVSMTPREAELYTEYGFLTEAYLRRAYKNMLGNTRAGQRITAPKLSPDDAKNTAPNTTPSGGLEVFNFTLRRSSQNDEALDAMQETYGISKEVDTTISLADLESSFTFFDPVRSVPGYRPEAKRKLRPTLSIDEAKGIRDQEFTYDEVFQIVKTEGRSLTKDQADLVRKIYGINVRASARRGKNQPLGYYVEWAENATQAGRARKLDEIKDDLRLADESEYNSYAEIELSTVENLEARLVELDASVRTARQALDDPSGDAALRIADDLRADADARFNAQRPMESQPGDPVVTVADDLNDGLNRTTWSPSRDENGMEEAIHQYQIARSVRVPSVQDMDELARQVKGSTRVFGVANEWFGKVVDGWSFATLFGPRFSLRNAIEEVLFYVLTGGRIGDLYSGRRASTALRSARPRFVYEEVVGETGEKSLELVIKTNLGLFNRLSRGYTLGGKLRDDMNQEWLAAITIPNATRDDFIKAQIAWQAGDTSAYVRLFSKALIRENANIPTNITARQQEALEWIAGSQHGMNLVQNVAEGGNSLLNGRLPNVVEDAVRLEDLAPGEVDAMLKSYPNFNSSLSGREFGALRPVQIDPTTRERINGVWYWWRELQATVNGDGPIGKLAIKYIGNPDAAKKAIADYVRQDSKWGYRKTWSMFAEGRDIDAAASRYYENVLRNFQKPSGEINWSLRNMFVDNIDGEDIVNWYRPRKPGQTPFDDFSKAEKTHRVSVQDLSKIPEKDRPSYVFGRLPSAPEPVPVLTGWEGFITKGYGILGRQNARISREPIFYANYLNMVKQLEKSDEAMANAMAKAAGRDAPNEFDKAIAAEWSNKTAADSAYAMTLAYVDNPANRSMLAWRVRNVARYYRATEDFYRRAKRLAITRPESYYRLALTYGLLDQTGFVFTDDNGQKYFYYPGNEYVQKAIGSFAAFISPELKPFVWDMASPFQIGGKVTGLTPSADPRMAVPTLIGPGTFPAAFAFDFFPPLKEFAGLRSALVGPYIEQQGSVTQLLLDTFTPAGVSKLQQLSQDEIDSVTQEAAFDTIKIMIAEGLLDPESLTAGDGVVGIESFMESDIWKQASTVGVGLAGTKFILGFLGPAAPQVYEAGQINPAARELGISSVDTVFRQLLDLNKDEPDPWSSAVSMYYAAKIRKNTGQPTKYTPWDNLLPFTLSGSKAAPDKLAGLAGIRATDAFVLWTQSDEYKNLENLPGASESLMWLAPPDGEFDWQAWQLITNTYGLRIPKTTTEKLESLFAVQGQYRDTQIRKSYDELISLLDPRDIDQKKAINLLNDAKLKERKLNEKQNPYWKTLRSKQGTAYTPTRLAESVKQMEIFIDSIRESEYEVPEALEYVDAAIDVYRNYKSAVSGLGQKKIEQQAKAELLYEMNTKLQNIAAGNEQAKKFIDTVLDTLNYGELEELDPLIVEEVS